jgi:hypothetical protein
MRLLLTEAGDETLVPCAHASAVGMCIREPTNRIFRL